MKAKTLKWAALELDAVRNERLDADDAELPTLAARVDAVGVWLSTRKMSDNVLNLLSEAHVLRMKFPATNWKRGDKVVCNGNHEARVIDRYNGEMFNVRLYSGFRHVGDVCVSGRDLMARND